MPVFSAKLKCFETLKKCQRVHAKSWRTKKNVGILSCSFKNRTECQWLLKDKMFLTFLLLFGLFDDRSPNKLGIFIITKVCYRILLNHLICFNSLSNMVFKCFFSFVSRYANRFIMVAEDVTLWNIEKKVEEKSWNFDKNANQLTQKVDGPKKNLGTLSCSVKNRTECPWLLKDKMFLTFFLFDKFCRFSSLTNRSVLAFEALAFWNFERNNNQ